LGEAGGAEYQKRLGELLEKYWKPVYVYIRARWRRTNEDAKDLTQAFFSHLLERDQLARLPDSHRSFRAYLKTVLQHFLIDEYRRSRIRQTEMPTLRLDEVGERERMQMEDRSKSDSPEKAYDAQWMNDLLRQSVGELQRSLEQEGKPLYFEAFRLYCLEPFRANSGAPSPLAGLPAESPTYEEVARRLGLKKSDVRNYLSVCRQRIFLLLRDRIRDTVQTEDEVKRELEELFGL